MFRITIVFLTLTLLTESLTLLTESLAMGEDRPTPTTFSREDISFFETRIRPLLVNKCGECHGADEQESELRLDTWDGIANGGKTGPLISLGKPDSSLLIVAVKYLDNDLRMPPDGKLSKQEIADLSRWIELGLPHPDRNASTAAPQPRREQNIDYDQARQFWSFRPVIRPELPAVQTSDRVATEIDRFIVARLEMQGLTLAAPADRRTLLRRVTFDLTGLPPTVEEIDAFLGDESPQAFATVVDRLLKSKHYGERWGRHWLDVARYADSNGLDENVAHGNAWRYRDYVVRSFNADKPYDAFLVEQIAGDLLPFDETDAAQREARRERLIATGFLSLGPKVLAEVDAVKMEMDIIDEQLDTIGKSLLGLTFGCARCHDHKFDPVSQRDYYGLAGIFKSTRVMENFTKVAKWHENEVPTDEDHKRKSHHELQVKAKELEIDQIVAVAKQKLVDALPPERNGKLEGDIESQFPTETRELLKKEREKLAELKKETDSLIPTAMGASDGEVTDLAIHLRGSHLTLGDPAPRQIPEVFTHLALPEFSKESSGRLQLARWLVDRKNPLTARVMVNRIWHWHFGQGLVASPDNFGLLGDRPTHPQLLDWLAAEFMESGWSINHMHRLILNSGVYQQSSARGADSKQAAVDPENRLLSRFPLRRMEAEVLRDSLLAVSGRLDRTMGGSLLTVANREWVFNHTSEDKTKYDSTRRSIYLPVIRNNLYDVFQLFDYSDASVINGHRDSSTVAPQALFMLNSDLVQDCSIALAEQLLSQDDLSDGHRIDLLCRRVFGRPPHEDEVSRLLTFAGGAAEDGESPEFRLAAWSALCHVILASNEFIYVR